MVGNTTEAMRQAGIALASRAKDRKFLEGLKNEVGVSDGVRTRDFRSHSRTDDDPGESER